MSLAPGTLLGRYRVREKLGAGGMGEVYLAEDTGELGRTVAVKLLPEDVAADPRRMQRFVQEARTVSGLTHPNILTVYDFGEAGPTRFVVTEYVEGLTLREYAAARRPKLQEVLDICAQVAAALDAAHEAGVVHRDIKPENIMLRRRDHIVKVLDFGLAKLAVRPAPASRGDADSQAATRLQVDTEPGVVVGTVSYMPPEQSRGEAVDERADIWSLGVVLYELVAGRLPFRGEDVHRQIIAIRDEEPPPLSRFAAGVPERLEEIVQKSLVKDPEERYQSAKDLLIDLQRLKRKLEVDAEIDRTAPPELRSAGAKTSSGESAATADAASNAQTSAAQTSTAQIAQASVAQTAPSDGARAVSSAEFVYNEIRRHKRAAAAVLALLAVASAALVAYRAYSARGGSGAAIESVAVLPFVNASGNPEVDYLSDGMTESLINSLSQIPGLSVKARSTVFRYKGRESDPQKVGAELGVQAVLSGRIVERGDDLTLGLELVDARTGDQIWGEQYKRKLAELVQLQSEIARDVSNKLRTKLSGAEEQKLAKSYTANPEAYRLYLRGRYEWNKRTDESYQKALDYFRQAIEKDPNYALAYTGLADCYSFMSSQSLLPPTEGMPLAKGAASKALELDNSLAEAHTSLAYVKLYYDWDWAGAEGEYRRAIELNPAYATPHHGYAYLLISTGRTDEALAEINRAEELDPLSLLINTDHGEFFYFARRPAQAIAQLRKAIDMDPTFVRAHFLLGRAYVQNGQCAEALAEFQRARALTQESTEMLAALGQGYAWCGRRAEAQAVLGRLTEMSRRSYISPHWFAATYAALGEKDKAFDWLDKSFERRFGPLIYLKVNPIWDGLRDDPRFPGLLRRVNLSP